MAIAVVQISSMASVANGTGTTKTMTTTVGNYLIVPSAYFANAGALTVSDDKGNSWSAAVISPSIGGSFNLSSIWYAKVATGGSTVITWALPSGSYLSGAAMEVSGLAASSVLDKTNSNTATTESSGKWPAVLGDLNSGTLSQADEIAVIVMCSSTTSAFSIDAIPSGFTTIYSNPDGNTIEFGDADYKIVSATTAIQPQWDFNAAASAFVGTGAIATFKQAGAGGSVIKTFGALANASTKTVLAVANASVKTFDGVANS